MPAKTVFNMGVKKASAIEKTTTASRTPGSVPPNRAMTRYAPAKIETPPRMNAKGAVPPRILLFMSILMGAWMATTNNAFTTKTDDLSGPDSATERRWIEIAEKSCA